MTIGDIHCLLGEHMVRVIRTGACETCLAPGQQIEPYLVENPGTLATHLRTYPVSQPLDTSPALSQVCRADDLKRAIDIYEASLWQHFATTRSGETRRALLSLYSRLVEHTLGRLALILPGGVARPKLLQQGMRALAHAIDSYESESGRTFVSYATAKIRRAFLDATLASSPIPRPDQWWANRMQSALAAHMLETGRYPSDRQLAERLVLDQVALYRHYDTAVLAMVSSEAMAVPAPNCEQYALVALAQAIDSLCKQEQYVLHLFYCKSLTIAEIREVLDLSEADVRHLHNRAMVCLWAYVRAHRDTWSLPDDLATWVIRSVMAVAWPPELPGP
ncbi:MAG: sigma-70 family RNA polymerase sigma factor [Anaerolineae bacterium]